MDAAEHGVTMSDAMVAELELFENEERIQREDCRRAYVG
jgi:hypothetical protein